MKTQRRRIVGACVFSVCFLLAGTVRAQESEHRVQMKDLPAAVQKTVREQSSGATLRGLAKEVEDGNTFYEAELRINGHSKDVLIDTAGVVVEIEEAVTLASLPAAVKAQLEKQAGKSKILVVESITKNATVVAYEAHLRKAGKRSEIKIAPDGTLLPADR
jgi:hypothetical protein